MRRGSALRKFPVLGDRIRENIRSFRGDGTALAAGVAGFYGALGAQSVQHALDRIWAVPRHARLDHVRARFLVALLPAGLAAITALSAAASSTEAFGVHVGAGSRLDTIRAVVLLSAALLLLTVRLLTRTEAGTRPLWVHGDRGPAPGKP
ncbi:hypothetical protein [Streptomyces phaeochromogenes]|uniref:hypothetical protein n=1 Tax=Streptomyces phaeochromogenes TaxID=1923 RepID=UPI00386C6521|nr:hypothetical protein OG277_34955 [Streptomyces phaeochromogenes]